MMQYMALIYHDAANPLKPAYGSEAFKTMMQGYFAFTAVLKQDGVYVSGEGLKDADTATTLRVRNGKVETMDGPFAETKEHLGGYYVMDVPDLDAALRYAAMIPTAAFGSIEIRPVMDYS